jgi:hypothetical protein
MCQSKSEGGIRCEAHAKKAINDHQLKFSQVVQQECLAQGIMIDASCYALTPEETTRVESRVNAEPAVKKAYGDVSEATRKRNRMRGTHKEALESGDVNRLAKLLIKNNPESQGILDANEARKRKFAEDTAKATNQKERDKAVAWNATESALIANRIKTINAWTTREATEAIDDYRKTGDYERIVHGMSSMKQVAKDIGEIRAKSDVTIRSERERQREATIEYKISNDPGFKDVATSTAFRNSEWYQKWDTKNKALEESYKMTSGYQNEVAAQISAHKKAGVDTTEMEAAHKDLTVRRAKFVYQNITEAHGTSSPEAKTAREAYDEAKQKEHVF